MNNKWIIDWGIHRGTYTSRDSGERKHFDTENEALQWVRDEENRLKSIGYMFWYVYLYSPDGSKSLLKQNSYQR